MTGTPPSTSTSTRALLSEAVASAATFDIPDPAHVRQYSPPSSQTPRPPLSPSSRRKPSPLPGPIPIPAPTTRQRQRQPSTGRLETLLSSCNSIGLAYCHLEHKEYSDHCRLSGGTLECRYSSSLPRGLSTSSQSISPRLEPSLLPYCIHSQPHSQPSHALQGHERKPSGNRKRTFSSASNRSSIARRPANLESPIRDPYRSRKPSASAKGVKNGRFRSLCAQYSPRFGPLFKPSSFFPATALFFLSMHYYPKNKPTAVLVFCRATPVLSPSLSSRPCGAFPATSALVHIPVTLCFVLLVSLFYSSFSRLSYSTPTPLSISCKIQLVKWC